MLGIELEKAVSEMLKSVSPLYRMEEVSLIKADKRVLAEDIYAPINNPPFDRSPLDGYALRSEDTKGASKENPISLKVVDIVYAGSVSSKKLQKDEAIRIMTGGAIPEGADCIIRVENTNNSNDYVQIYEQLSKYDNYCFTGEDIEKGELLIEKGTLLTYVHIGILSSMGYSKVKVYETPKIGLIVTGDEVCDPNKDLKPGKIYDSNLHLIYSRLKDFNMEPFYAGIAGDSAEGVASKINAIINTCDVIITTGGVSVGDKDIIHEVIPMINAKQIFWKVNLQPGTPAIYSLCREKPVISLSGNPFAAIATFELLARPVLAKLSNNEDMKTKYVEAVMENEFNKKSKKRRFIRAYYKNGKVRIVQNKHSSGMLFSMLGCNCLIDIAPGTPKLSAGDKVNVVLL